MKALLLSLLAIVLLCGSAWAAKPKMTAESVATDCKALSPPYCFSRCDDFSNLVANTTFKSKKECRAACNKVFQQASQKEATGGCERAADVGQQMCTKFCNQNYR